jgi:hypothetical protein
MVMMLNEGVTSLRKGGVPLRPESLANDRHERHHRHEGENTAYLSLFLHDAHHDDEVTLTQLPTNSPSGTKPYRYGEK